MPRPPFTTFQAGALSHRAVDLRGVFGADLDRMPWVLRIVAENRLRHAEGADIAEVTDPFRHWLVHGHSDAEVAFRPRRVMMHDTTCGPALVDIAAMRDVIAEAGGDPATLVPTLRCDVSTDHSLAVDHFGHPNAQAANMEREFARNAERYRLMKWAAATMPGFHVHPPGTGIMHTINLEQLASVIDREDRDGFLWAVPDTLIGTDSHTPMVNGIGVLGWGVGGLEAECVLFGLPVMLKLPDVVGVLLTGRLRAGTLSTDLALTVTQRLREEGVAGDFVEFHGPGVAGLSAGDRAVVANMAPEYGATTGFFPVDGRTTDYLRTTGRAEADIARVTAGARAMGLWFDPEARPRYTRTITLDLDRIGPSLAGPRRPQDRVAPAGLRPALEAAQGRPLSPQAIDGIPDGAIAIAAITSCTNTSDPALLVRAGLLARKARALGLRPPPWVKTSLAPGSPAARSFLQHAGLLDDLSATGFDIVGFGCTTCIGNSGPLVPGMARAVDRGLTAVAVLSGNRNFPGRVHPALSDGFLASPPMVVALALAGDVARDPTASPLTVAPDGRDVWLNDIWPTEAEVDAALALAQRPDDHRTDFAAAALNPMWRDLTFPETTCFPWDPASTYLRRPPFARPGAQRPPGAFTARILLSLGDDITTDHISPAGQIGAGSLAGQYLVAQGAAAADLNVYAARRGNWEVMVRGLFDNRAVRNLLGDGARPGQAVMPDGQATAAPWVVAQAFAKDAIPLVLFAGERYGTGSSRDWAAKGLALLGVRAVLARSVERIHRSNLINMGVLPLTLPPGCAIAIARLGPTDTVEIAAAALGPQGEIPVTIRNGEGEVMAFSAIADIQTAQEAAILAAGGAIPHVLEKHLAASAG